jgi:acyl phosphate:glycerol-3-phosphate acyltransferase
MESINTNLLFYLVAYLVAAIPFGYLLAKQFAGVDIKNAGSGNIGATNVLRVVKEKDPKLARKLGAITLLLDALKGAVVILVAKLMGLDNEILWTLAVLSVLGHCFSVFLAFDGGKGVATGFGVFAVMMPIPALIAVATWGIAAKVLKISSLSSLIGLVGFVIASYILYPEAPHAPVWIITLVIFYKHTPNIVRLFNKEEGAVV